MPQNEVKIIITTDVSGAVTGVKQLGDAYSKTTKQIETETQSFMSKAKQDWVVLAASIAGAMVVANKAMEYISLGAKAQQAEESFHRVAESYHEDANKILAEMKRVSAGTVDDSDIMQKAVKGMVQGLSGDELVKIMETARISARLTGEDVTTAYENITDAIANQMPRALRRYGLVTKEQLEIMNKAIAAGVGDINLLTFALLNAEKQAASFGAIIKTTSEELQRQHAMWKEIRETVGKVFINMIDGAKGAGKSIAEYIVKGLAVAVRGIMEVLIIAERAMNKIGLIPDKRLQEDIESLEKLRNFKIDWGDSEKDTTKVGTSVEDADKKLKGMMDNLKKMIDVAKNKDKIDELTKSIKDWGRSLEEQSPLLTEHEKDVLQVTNAYEKLLDEYKKLGAKPPKELEETFKRGLEIVDLKKSIKDLDDYRKALQEAGQAEIELQKNISLVYAGELGKRMMEIDDWVSQQHELAFKIARDWVDYAAMMERIDTATAKKRLDITKEYYRQVQEAEIQNQLALVDIQEKTFAISQDEATEKRIGLKQEELRYLKDQYDDLIGITGKELERLQVLSKITGVQATLTDLVARQGGFSEGVKRGINEYLRSLEYNFDRGKQIVMDFAKAGEDALVKMFDNPKEAIKDLWKFFVDYLKRMVAQAAMSRIVIPITTVMFGGTATQASAGVLGGGGTGLLGGFGGGLNQVTGLLGDFGGAIFGGTDALSDFTSSLWELGIISDDMFATGLGAITDFLPILGAATGMFGMFKAYQTKNPLLGGISGVGAGMAIGSIIPGVGTLIGGIVGGVVGLLGGLFGKKKELPEAGLAWHTGTEGYPGKGWSAGITAGEGGFAEGYFKNIGLDKEAKAIADMFVKIREVSMDTFKDLGMDIQGFYKDWNYYIGDLTGKSAEDIQKAFETAIASYIQFASGLDFTKWQKSGEELSDTVNRIMSALVGINKFGDSIDDMISAIKGDTDIVMNFKENLNAAIDNIKQMETALQEATDPADAYALAQQLQQTIYETYTAAYQAVKGLIDSLHQLEEAAFRFSFNLQKTIDGLRGTTKSLDMIYAAGQELLSRYFSTTDISEKLRLLQLGIEVVTEGLAITIQQIQDSYQARIDALYEEKELINEQISNLQEQLNLVRAWSSVLESVKKQISDMVTSPELNPADYLELLGYKRQEIEKMQGLYAGATGEEKAGYATQLQSLISEYLQLGQQAYQFPSPEYMALYQESLVWLQQIQADAEKYAESETDILKQIEDLEAQSKAIDEQIKSLNEQMAQDIKAAQLQAADYYQWIQTEGATLYQQKIDEMRSQLAEILGDKTAEQYLADLQFAAVNELILIRKLLNDVAASLVPGFIPQYQSGGYVSKTGLALVHAGEEVVPAGRSASSVTQHIVISPQITISGGDSRNNEQLAEVVERTIIKSFKKGKGRQLLKDEWRYITK